MANRRTLARAPRRRPRSPVRERAATLSLAQQQVAAAMLDDPEFALHANVDALARRAKVSPPTIIRFCRALGFAGLRDFKLRLAQSLAVGNVDAAPRRRARRRHADGDAQGAAGRGERARESRAARRAGGNRARRRAASPRRGASTATASATCRCSWRATRRRASRGSASTSNAYFDAHLQLDLGRHDEPRATWCWRSPTSAGCQSCSMRSEVAQEQGATIVAITQPDTPLAEVADIVLPVVVPADPSMRVGTEAYLAQLAYLEILMVGVGLRRGPPAFRQLEARAPGAAGARRRQRDPSGAAVGVVEARKAIVRRNRGTAIPRCSCAAAPSSTAPARPASLPTCASTATGSPRSAPHLPAAGAEVDRRQPADRRARLHRRPHARRPDRARGAADAAEDQPGRDHRRRRQLRHQPGAARARRTCRRR